MGWEFVDRILTHSNDLCLLLNPSAAPYRRLTRTSAEPDQGVADGSRLHDSYSDRQ
jgi:glutamine synthetase